jgi:hypothetical protein
VSTTHDLTHRIRVLVADLEASGGEADDDSDERPAASRSSGGENGGSYAEDDIPF